MNIFSIFSSQKSKVCLKKYKIMLMEKDFIDLGWGKRGFGFAISKLVTLNHHIEDDDYRLEDYRTPLMKDKSVPYCLIVRLKNKKDLKNLMELIKINDE